MPFPTPTNLAPPRSRGSRGMNACLCGTLGLRARERKQHALKLHPKWNISRNHLEHNIPRHVQRVQVGLPQLSRAPPR